MRETNACIPLLLYELEVNSSCTSLLRREYKHSRSLTKCARKKVINPYNKEEKISQNFYHIKILHTLKIIILK